MVEREKDMTTRVSMRFAMKKRSNKGNIMPNGYQHLLTGLARHANRPDQRTLITPSFHHGRQVTRRSQQRDSP